MVSSYRWKTLKTRARGPFGGEMRRSKWRTGVPGVSSRWNSGGLSRAVAWVRLLGHSSGVKVVEGAFLSGFLLGWI